MMGPQLFLRAHDPETNGTCALGSIQLAVGLEHAPWKRLLETFPGLEVKVPTQCAPLTNHMPISVALAISILNDAQRWSRERIADWLIESGYDCGYVKPADAWDNVQPNVAVFA